MRIGIVLLNLMFAILISCGDKNVTTEEDSADTNGRKSEISARVIEDFVFKDYVLSPNGEKEVAKWEKYQELAIQINYLRKADLSFFNGDKELLKKFIDEFINDLPPEFDTKPIASRNAIIKTTLLRLNENLTIDNIDTDLKLESIKEVLIAFSNLNYQINKKLERDIYEKIESEF